jgi:DNA-binding CsgD family transcriptional regulator
MTTAARKAPLRAGHQHLTLHAFLLLKLSETGLTNAEIAEKLGYDRGNVIAMLKSGSMKLPLNKIAAMADVIGVDRVYLLEKALMEVDPSLWDILSNVMGGRPITNNERALLDHIRGFAGDLDIDWTSEAEFTRTIDPVLKSTAKRVAAEMKGSVDRATRERINTAKRAA